MKVIFLDIDGVLNSMDWYKRRTRVKSETWDQYHAQEFDPVALALIKRVISETGARVVLSSTWRLSEEGVTFIKGLGIDILDCTPRLPRPSGSSVEYCERGKEIQVWLDERMQQAEAPCEMIDRYVIIDDDTDMLPEQTEYCFHTDNKFGLTEPIAKEIIWYLNKK